MTDKAPVTISGKVYVCRYLAPHYPERKLPDVLKHGDIRVDSHLDERGRANRQANTKKARMRGFSGYFSAMLWDGENWRRFKIAKIVGPDGYYSTQRMKQEKIHGVFWSLESIAGRVAVVGDGAYELTAKDSPPVEAPPPAPPPPAPLQPKAQEPVSESAQTPQKPVQLSLF